MVVGVADCMVGWRRRECGCGPWFVGVLKEPDQTLGGRVGRPRLALEEDRVVVVVVHHQPAPDARYTTVSTVDRQLEGATLLNRRSHGDLGVGKVIREDLGADAVNAARGNVAARVGALSCEEVGGLWVDRVGFGRWGCVEVSCFIGGTVV